MTVVASLLSVAKHKTAERLGAEEHIPAGVRKPQNCVLKAHLNTSGARVYHTRILGYLQKFGLILH